MGKFKQFLNEGTEASIVVKLKDGSYRVSVLRYDGMDAFENVRKFFNSQKKAEMLVQETGEIKDLNNGKVEFYKDDNMLGSLRNEKDALKYARSEFSVDYVVLWNGTKWLDMSEI